MPRLKSEEARNKMISAALQLCMEGGVGAVTVAAIVERSGVAKTTFYRHFKSVSELVICSIEEHHEPQNIPDTGALQSDLLALAEMMLPIYSQSDSRQMITSLLHASAIDPELRELHCLIDEQRTEPVEVLLQRAIQRGELPDTTNLKLAAELVEGPFIKRILIRQEEMSNAEIKQFVDWICRGLGAKDPT